MLDNSKPTQEMYDILQDTFEKYTKTNPFGKHYIATITNVYNGFADLTILDSETQRTKIKVRNGLDISIGDIVFVLAINGSYSNLIVDFKLNDNFFINKIFYNRNRKNIIKFNNASNFDSGNLDLLNYYYDNSSLKLIENDDTGGEIIATQEFSATPLIVDTYNSGQFSLLTDFISSVFYVSDHTKTTNVKILLKTDDSNYFSNIITSLETGMNYNLLPKCEWVETGSPDWNSISKVTVSWTSENNAQNEFVSFNNIELIENKLECINCPAHSGYDNGGITYDTTNLGRGFPQSNPAPNLLFNINIPKNYFNSFYIYPRVIWKQPGLNATTKFCIDYKVLKTGTVYPVSFTTYEMDQQQETYILSSTMSQANYNKTGILLENIDSKNDDSVNMLVKLYRNDSGYAGNLIVHNLVIYYPVI